VNEALIALLIEARYDKHRILEAYTNEVFLRSAGGQAVHAFAAAAEFYFGREPKDLNPADIALLVVLVQGPSLYDPRRHPDLALARRNRVLGEFYETGLIDEARLNTSRAAPLGVPDAPGLPRNTTPRCSCARIITLQLRRTDPDAVWCCVAGGRIGHAQGAARDVFTCFIDQNRSRKTRRAPPIAPCQRQIRMPRGSLQARTLHQTTSSAMSADLSPLARGRNKTPRPRRSHAPPGHLLTEKNFICIRSGCDVCRNALRSTAQ